MGVPWSRPTDGRPSSRVLQEREVIERIIARDTGMDCHARDLPAPAAHLINDLAMEASEAPSPSNPNIKADTQYAEPTLKLAPTEAFQRYQNSAAEAAAHPPQENGQAHPAEGAQNRRKRDIGSAPGNSHRSRKRRVQAASQSQGPEAHGMHAHAEAEGQASGPSSESTPSSAAERRGEVQKSLATPAAQTPKSTGGMSKGWQYVGPDLKCAGVNQDDWVHCPDGRSYPRSMTYKEGDLLVEEYLGKTDDDQLYEVEDIIDERRRGKVREFRVKWKGFEMNPEEFMPYRNLRECAALDQWEAKLGILHLSEQ